VATITVVEGQVVVGSSLPGSVAPGSALRIPADTAHQAATGSPASASVPDTGSSTHLSAGQQVTVALNADEPLKPQPASVDTATAWTQQKLVFRASSLPEVAQEFNRYNKRQLVIADAALVTFRISGVYSSTDPALLLTFLREQPGIRVEETESSFIITQRE
jgi:transmembrane sensor